MWAEERKQSEKERIEGKTRKRINSERPEERKKRGREEGEK